ncbi:5-formyltetrahydrofolate cyclo-ligase [Calothrix sp. PCC 6303]|uniref:5-formyltetrahydrofolate cyclo-ligase n=1 Tax=Calothrix sp. PCC 6303 TaxID=1170562 RepID=UPI0002A03472|nr:5-formyltetrahydrofolate cyclo-ligase [Calothrix sp. PCC 6303]AFZ00065.1 5-formyltetrahydrofolate cyclo-ligase [Calothrix sp. PCC 6303]
MNKQELRRNLLKKRQLMTQQEWKEKSDRISAQLLDFPLFQEAKTILAYFSFRQEPDLSCLYKNYHHRKIWGFPRCEGKSLIWHIWKPGDALQTGAYGISEPDIQNPLIKSAEVDLILVPSVACDALGYRLGYGGGYYDRLLSSPQWKNPVTMGIVFEFAYFPELPIEAWDQPLNYICTDTGIKIQN